ncbi:MAG: hypothetical protein K1060chlam5_00162 [Candidatus Anoxychlamydiales bacterium]|nr:hypothetical protein [Candidatus Anoxychlamydiales bacterium]
MYLKKRFFFLIEVIIALFLAAILITMLFSFFANVTKIERDVEKAKHVAFQNENLQIRLNQIFSEIKLNSENFYLDDQKALNFIFDNGIDPISEYSDEIFGKISLDKDQNLNLFLYPNEKIDVPRKEILFKNVKKIEYKFLYKKDDKIKIEKSFASKDLYWHYNWPNEIKKVPICICIKINDDIDFSFFIAANPYNAIELKK